MQIHCHSCRTEFVIEDRLITEGGLRAQCPECKQLQTVTLPSKGQPANLAAAGSPVQPGPAPTIQPRDNPFASPKKASAPNITEAAQPRPEPMQRPNPVGAGPDAPPMSKQSAFGVAASNSAPPATPAIKTTGDKNSPAGDTTESDANPFRFKKNPFGSGNSPNQDLQATQKSREEAKPSASPPPTQPKDVTPVSGNPFSRSATGQFPVSQGSASSSLATGASNISATDGSPPTNRQKPPTDSVTGNALRDSANPFSTNIHSSKDGGNPFSTDVLQPEPATPMMRTTATDSGNVGDAPAGNLFSNRVGATSTSPSAPSAAIEDLFQDSSTGAEAARPDTQTNAEIPTPGITIVPASNRGSIDNPRLGQDQPSQSAKRFSFPSSASTNQTRAKSEAAEESAHTLDLDSNDHSPEDLLPETHASEQGSIAEAGSSGKTQDTPFHSHQQPQLWQLDAGNAVESNLSLVDLKYRLKQGIIGPHHLAGRMGEKLIPIGRIPELTSAKTTGRKSIPSRAAPKTRTIPIWVFALVATVALVLVSAVGYRFLPTTLESWSEEGINPFRSALPVWATQFPNVEGTSQEHLVRARRLMRSDTAIGYQKADEHLRQAILLEVGNHAALGSFIENFSYLPQSNRLKADTFELVQEGIAYLERISQSNPTTLRAKGAFHMAFGNIRVAQEALAQADRLLPDDPHTRILLARSYLDFIPNESKRIIQTVRVENPELPAAALVDAGALRRVGQYREAKTLLASLRAKSPEHIGILLELAGIDIDLVRPKAALKWLDQAVNIETNNAQIRIIRATVNYQLAEKRKPAEADLKFVVDELVHAPKNVLGQAYSHFSYLRLLRGSGKEAVDLAEKAIEFRPEHAPSHAILGRALARENRLEEANQAFLSAVRLFDAAGNNAFLEPIARTFLADLQLQRGDLSNAIRNYENTIKSAPYYVRPYLGVAAAFGADGKPAPSASAILHLNDIDPFHALYRKHITDLPEPKSDIELYLGKYAGASVTPDGLLQQSLGKAVLLFHAGRVTKSKAVFRSVLKKDPENLSALFHLGAIYVNENKFKSAKKILSKASVLLKRKNLIVESYLGRAELETGSLKAAEQRLEDVLSENPGDTLAFFNLALVRQKQDRFEEARGMLQKIQIATPAFAPAKQMLMATGL
jgi:tetratricopeptide (TPR) repeat protein